MNFKLGFGPMSSIINETLATYSLSNQTNLMIVASRNQIDYDSGYVSNTKDFVNFVKSYKSPHLMLCRDHCGPYFLDSEKDLSLRDAIEKTKKTIASDIENGFDLIHIDTSRTDNPYKTADELFSFCLKLNPKLYFEFGTEENIGLTAGLESYKQDVKFASQFPNVKFVVAQTGSLTMEDKQVGTFDVKLVSQLVRCAEQYNVMLKEHNADYLTASQIKLRQKVGVHACNIAPQLGVIQTKTVLSLAESFRVDTNDFKNLVLSSNKWLKWILNGDNTVKINIAGHYCFNSNEYKKLEEEISKYIDVRDYIKKEIESCLTLYCENLL